MWGKKKKEKEQNKEKVIKPGSFASVVEIAKMLFKKREYSIDKQAVNKDAKKALILTIIIIVGLGLLLWFLPFTHQFFEDILFLRR